MKKVKRVKKKNSKIFGWIVFILVLALIAAAMIIGYFGLNEFILPAPPVQTDFTQVNWGYVGAVPVPGDYNGDGKSDLAVYEAANKGSWWILDMNGSGIKAPVNWGYAETVPVPGDYNGDGKSDLAVYDATNGKWWILDSNEQALYLNVSWGFAGSKGLSGDFDGDGADDIAVWGTNSTGAGNWFVYSPSKSKTLVWNLAWGSAGMTPFVGDFDGDGKADVAAFDVNSTGTGLWYIYSISKQQALLWNFGYGTVLPMTPFVGDFDGDNVEDIGLYGPDTGNWWVYSLAIRKNILWYYSYSEVKGGVPVPGDYNRDGKVEPAVYDAASKGFWGINAVAPVGPSIPPDTTAPVLSEPQPLGIINLTAINIGIKTDEDAVCGYSLENIPFPQIASSTAGILFEEISSYQKVHNATITVDSNGSKSYYISCIDRNNNYNAQPFNLTFFVNTSYTGSAETPDLTAPVISNLRPIGIINTTNTTIQVDTDEDANCAYSTSDTIYANMMPFNTTGALAHSAQVFDLLNGTTPSYYVRCQDAAGNANTVSANITFTVDFDYDGSVPPAETCIDSDGGLDYLIVGNVNSSISGYFIDSCSESNLTEYTCRVDNVAEMTTYTCPNGCSDGACLGAVPPVTENNITINVTENPQITITYMLDNYTLFISLRNNGTEDVASVFSSTGILICPDRGVGETCEVYGFTLLFEYINADSGIVIISVTPSGTIIEQPPITAPSVCIDSDGGNDYFIFGNATGPTHPFDITAVFVDECANSSLLNEAVCSPTYAGIVQANCIYGCLNGACNTGCISGETWNGVTCVDSAEQASCNPTECFYSEGKCLVYGYRILSDGIRRYCNNVNFLIQEPVNSTCTWDNECESNFCVGGLCRELAEATSGTQGLLDTVLCWFQNIFGIQNPNCPS